MPIITSQSTDAAEQPAATLQSRRAEMQNTREDLRATSAYSTLRFTINALTVVSVLFIPVSFVYAVQFSEAALKGLITGAILGCLGMLIVRVFAFVLLDIADAAVAGEQRSRVSK